MKSKNIKIKHRKYSLYNKKKSKGRQALAIILTIVIAAALCVVGFGLGRPIMEYFQNKNNGESTDSGSAWTPPVSEVTSETSAPTAEAETAESAEPLPAEKPSEVFVLPVSAVRNIGALNSALTAAKSNGYTAVMITLKNAAGNFLYKSEVAGIKDSQAIIGELTAKQIADAVIGAGMTPQARISTLRDPISGNYVADVKYMTSDGYTWLDAAPDNGGKSWLSPFSENTPKYIADITSELAAAGFKKIIYADTVFPAFLNADDAYIGHLPIRNEQERLNALWKVIGAGAAAASADGAEVMLEMNAADLEAAVKLSTTAEAAGDRTKLRSVELLIDFTADSGSEYASARTFAGKMGSLYGGQSYSVLIGSGAAQAEVVRAFTEADITVYSE